MERAAQAPVEVERVEALQAAGVGDGGLVGGPFVPLVPDLDEALLEGVFGDAGVGAAEAARDVVGEEEVVGVDERAEGAVVGALEAEVVP
ncbi:hypothetical protein GKE82_11445 [Conexibacter sp. W3-3-2]|uniref:hypothetical protein n=1 Tax=Conexibacter sp. W3-3-2 TaxID=2675227 RepID=UPI0012B8B064|nr:hypothetical protein [Conexibacter sp. W3-3-2]MTD44889.1 hypothetical protein [Conexibacter sp. W3-3-2]